MARGVDIHFHLLPGVDDGPAQLADSLELARAAVEDGCEIVVATPHVREDFVTDVLLLPELARELRAELARGAVAQINALSLTGEHGEDAERAALRLVAGGLATAVASDAHGGVSSRASSIGAP